MYLHLYPPFTIVGLPFKPLLIYNFLLSLALTFAFYLLQFFCPVDFPTVWVLLISSWTVIEQISLSCIFCKLEADLEA